MVRSGRVGLLGDACGHDATASDGTVTAVRALASVRRIDRAMASFWRNAGGVRSRAGERAGGRAVREHADAVAPWVRRAVAAHDAQVGPGDDDLAGVDRPAVVVGHDLLDHLAPLVQPRAAARRRCGLTDGVAMRASTSASPTMSSGWLVLRATKRPLAGSPVDA